jgi:hypothetical protein
MVRFSLACVAGLGLKKEKKIGSRKTSHLLTSSPKDLDTDLNSWIRRVSSLVADLYQQETDS